MGFSGNDADKKAAAARRARRQAERARRLKTGKAQPLGRLGDGPVDRRTRAAWRWN